MNARERRALAYFATVDVCGPPPRGAGDQTMRALVASGLVRQGGHMERGRLVHAITDKGREALRLEAADARALHTERDSARNRRQYVRLRKFHRDNGTGR